MRNKTYLWVIIGLLSTSFLFSQGHPRKSDGPDIDGLRAIKTGLITQALSLTPEQAQEFWPVYNEFDAQLMASQRTLSNVMRETKPSDIDNWSDEKIDATLAMIAQHKQKEQELIGNMQNALKDILTPRQMLQLHLSKERFKRRLIKRMNTRGRQQKGRVNN
jgi:Spy/CpxP family protein refolding chaperone